MREADLSLEIVIKGNEGLCLRSCRFVKFLQSVLQVSQSPQVVGYLSRFSTFILIRVC